MSEAYHPAHENYVLVDCWHCHGGGEIGVPHPTRDPQLEETARCPTCSGQGTVAIDRVESPPAGPDGVLCPACKGHGQPQGDGSGWDGTSYHTPACELCDGLSEVPWRVARALERERDDAYARAVSDVVEFLRAEAAERPTLPPQYKRFKPLALADAAECIELRFEKWAADRKAGT